MKILMKLKNVNITLKININRMDYDFYGETTGWLNEQWQLLTFEHILYLLAFSFVLSYITEYVLKFKQLRLIYYTLCLILLFKLFEGGHKVSGVESVYKLILI